MTDAPTPASNARKNYLRACGLIALIGWFPGFFIEPVAGSGTLFQAVLQYSGFVLGTYCSLEMFRSRRRRWAKVLWAIWLAPQLLLVGWLLYRAVPYVPGLFAASALPLMLCRRPTVPIDPEETGQGENRAGVTSIGSGMRHGGRPKGLAQLFQACTACRSPRP